MHAKHGFFSHLSDVFGEPLSSRSLVSLLFPLHGSLLTFVVQRPDLMEMLAEVCMPFFTVIPSDSESPMSPMGSDMGTHLLLVFLAFLFVAF